MTIQQGGGATQNRCFEMAYPKGYRTENNLEAVKWQQKMIW